MTVSLRTVYLVALAVAAYAALQQPSLAWGIVVAAGVFLSVVILASFTAAMVGVTWR